MNNLTEAQIKSIEAKLQKLAASEGRTGMQARTLFLLERAVARMVLDSELQRCLVFKGGFVSLRVYGSQRFTTDVDATLRGISAEDATRRILEAMKGNLGDGAWFHFESKEETSAQNEYGGLSLKFRSGLGTPPKKLRMHYVLASIWGSVIPSHPQPFTFALRYLLEKVKSPGTFIQLNR